MDIQKRLQNEKKFKSWVELPNGCRSYSYGVQGRKGWSARYVKIVSPEEETLSFCQEIYDNTRKLVAVHVKYPRDFGHIMTSGDEG
jgi:hypothetical protein